MNDNTERLERYAELAVRGGALNQLYAQQGRVSANDFAAKARADYENDAALMKHFNTEFAGGKCRLPKSFTS